MKIKWTRTENQIILVRKIKKSEDFLQIFGMWIVEEFSGQSVKFPQRSSFSTNRRENYKDWKFYNVLFQNRAEEPFSDHTIPPPGHKYRSKKIIISSIMVVDYEEFTPS